MQLISTYLANEIRSLSTFIYFSHILLSFFSHFPRFFPLLTCLSHAFSLYLHHFHRSLSFTPNICKLIPFFDTSNIVIVILSIVKMSLYSGRTQPANISSKRLPKTLPFAINLISHLSYALNVCYVLVYGP